MPITLPTDNILYDLFRNSSILMKSPHTSSLRLILILSLHHLSGPFPQISLSWIYHPCYTCLLLDSAPGVLASVHEGSPSRFIVKY
jgi:hypothetical protein